MKHVLLSVALLATVASVTPTAQSLADIARQEEARRKAVEIPGKVYTNADLKPDPTRASSPSTEPDPAGLSSSSTTVPQIDVPGGSLAEIARPSGQATEAVEAEDLEDSEDSEERGEAYWRQRITAARVAHDRSQVLADALQSRLNALATDIVNRDDPAQRSQLELERQRAVAELDRTQKEIAEHARLIAEIEEEARKAGVPPGWLR